MNRMSWLLVVPLALVSALSVPAGCVEFDVYKFYDGAGAGGVGGTDGGNGAGGTGGSGGAPACMSDAECTNNECRTGGACKDGACQWETQLPANTLVGTQVYGDCKQQQCDASGNVVQVDDPADVYEWGNACYQTACNAWTNLQPAIDKLCGTTWGKAGKCDGEAKCIECAEDVDCGNGKCLSVGKCIPLHCTNGVHDSVDSESDVDCGGPCGACSNGASCNTPADCEKGSCTGNPKTCSEPSCSDGFKNGDETDLNCGGSCPTKCGQGKGCLLPTDCAAGLSCKSGTCQP